MISLLAMLCLLERSYSLLLCIIYVNKHKIKLTPLILKLLIKEYSVSKNIVDINSIVNIGIITCLSRYNNICVNTIKYMMS
jgi:hypothetical protein